MHVIIQIYLLISSSRHPRKRRWIIKMIDGLSLKNVERQIFHSYPNREQVEQYINIIQKCRRPWNKREKRLQTATGKG